VGPLSSKAASDWGLPAGIPVGSGVIDAYAGWIGTVGAKHDLSSTSLSTTDDVSQAFGRLAAVAGTSTCHLAMSADPIFVPGVWGPYRDVLVPHFWVAEGGQSATGELLKHIIETHPAHAEAKSLADRDGGRNIYDYLDNLLHEMQKKVDAPSVSWLGRHFFLYGDLFGNRSPIADPHMTGSIIGLTSNKGVDSLALHYYGTMEFIALQTRHIIDTMNKAGHAINGIYMSGSQCQNKILMGLIATVCGLPVIIPRYVTAAVCHGAAMLGAKAASGANDRKTEDLWSIMSRMSKPGEVVMPGKDVTEKRLLDVKYEVFLEMARVQQVYRGKVDKVVKDWLGK
jgi:FGGY-family pentulose kinase